MAEKTRTKRDQSKMCCTLTPEEINQAQYWLLNGVSVEEIADRYGLAPSTIIKHVKTTTSIRSVVHKETYSTQEVLDLIQMSRYTLRRKRKEGLFPDPVYKGDKSNEDPSLRCDRYNKVQIDDWVQRHSSRVMLKASKNSGVYLKLSKDDFLYVHKACQLLECDLEIFMRDAVLWKAKHIIESIEG